jgi:hypothetical protein
MMATTLGYEMMMGGAPPEAPDACLERSYIIEYLKGKGYTLRDLISLPPELARQLRVEASIYASTKLAELETRSRLVHDLHGEK